jgi:putative DNA primase/helicase
MADLTNVLGGPWSPPKVAQPDPPAAQLLDAMQRAGLTPPREIVLDGKMHRFNSGTKGSPGAGDKSGWYVAYSDGIPAGRFGCWRAGMESTWRADVGRSLTPAEEMAHARRMNEAKAARDAETARTRETAANTVEAIWTGCMGADPAHPYLERKGIGINGSRVTGDGRLVVPLYAPDGKLASLQYIDVDGGKLYHSGGQTGGCYWTVGTMDEPGTVYIAEGFATAATIHEVTGRPCVVAYSASNLVPVTGTIRELVGIGGSITIVADNDSSGTGQKYADQASAKYGARIVMPPTPGDANDYLAAGYDLKVLLVPLPVTDWLTPADDFCLEPAPIRWLVKHWLQEAALIMVHGPSGGGKTFAVLDWSLHIASGMTEWHSHRVKPGPVVYLAGEGHHGLRSRVAAWKQHHGAGRLDMWISKTGTDLNTPEGYQRVVDAIRALPHPPSLINVDTLHRFLAGDENSSVDAKTMIDACAALMREFSCSVLLVHHTGVSDEAQHRARGSSAWKGALEIEISVIPAKGDAPIQIVQRKSKDAEEAAPIYARLQAVAINGWLDEDGEAVSSAVLVAEEAPPERRKESKLDMWRKLFEAAWWASGAEIPNGQPFVSRSALLDYLKTKLDLTEAYAQQYLKPSVTDKLIGALILAEIVERNGAGFAVICQQTAGLMIMMKNSEK